jgi:ubiquitin carboxyl-terminal hydrolase 5/13
MTTEDGKELTPLFGPCHTGLKNLGNSCYMASALQCLFSLSSFEQRYWAELMDHPTTCFDKPSECFLCQTHKLADGLYSGRYSVPSKVSDASTPESTREPRKLGQSGISPAMLKDLVGKDHPEFSTMRQQDVFEFIDYFLKLADQKEINDRKQSPVRGFEFTTEQRLQCTECHRVKYKSTNESALPLFVPLEKKSVQIQTERPSDDDIYEPVSFDTCLEHFFEAAFNDGYKCPQCNKTTMITR